MCPSRVCVGAGIVLIWASAAADEVGFARKPTAVKVGDTVTVTFAVNRATDVAVTVEDAQGRIVRHLAAGVLGANVPAPLKPNTLEQTIAWDGTDDLGRRAAGAPFRVRVAAGLKADYAGTAFAERPGPNTLAGVIGLACGPGGRLTVMSRRWQRGWWNATTMHVFRRDGSYERTIKPFSGALPPDRVKAITALTGEDGRPVPVIYRVVAMTFYPNEDVGQQMAVTPDGNVHFVVVPPAYRKWPDKRLATIDADGGVPYDTYAGAVLATSTAPGNVYLAPSSDGKAVYVTGLERGGGEKPRPNLPTVWKVPLPKRDAAQIFFGDPKAAGHDTAHLLNPRGLATDGTGRLLIADTGNNRIVVVRERDASVLATIPVPEPLWVGVHHKSGAVYVHSKDRIIKFSGWTGAKQVSSLSLPRLTDRERARTQWTFALDHEAEPAVLWVGRNAGDDCLLRCTDDGGKWSDLTRAGYFPARNYWNVSVGQDRRQVACKVGHYTLRVLDEATGKTRDLRLTGSHGQTYRLGPNGQIYGIDHWKWGVRRWDKDGTFMPFKASAADPEFKGRLFNRPSGTTSWERDFCVDRAGNVYTKHRGKIYHGRMRVDEYDRDGAFKRTAIWVVTDGAHGPKVDAQGNLYIAECIKPPGVPYPAFFQGKLPKVKIDKKGDVAYQYRWMYGSIIKFSPKGGAVWFPVRRDNDAYAFDGEARVAPGLKKEPFEFAQGDRMKIDTGEVQGALWWRFGCAFLLDMHPGHNRRCHCTATDFDVDDFGRVFYPDQGRFRVAVLDTNGNAITTIGRYGNQDDARDEIAFTWMVGLGVSDKYLYVADALNRQVQRCRLTYRAEATCEVK